MEYFAIRNKKTGEMLRYGSQRNEDTENCVDVSYYFTEYKGDYVWLIDKREKAEKALFESTPWYNADYKTPEYGGWLIKENYEVVKVEIIVKEE
jgi:hypothetical protein